jgi:hypothetical protein
MAIVATFWFRGELYLVTALGTIFRINTKGSAAPSDWQYELVTEIR